jgi:hypothetical protein
VLSKLCISFTIFILTSSGAVQHTKITGSVIEAGQAAIRNALLGAIFTSGGPDSRVASAATSALNALVDSIWTHYTAYEANISRNGYVYNGCSWLI